MKNCKDVKAIITKNSNGVADMVSCPCCAASDYIKYFDGEIVFEPSMDTLKHTDKCKFNNFKKKDLI